MYVPRDSVVNIPAKSASNSYVFTIDRVVYVITTAVTISWGVRYVGRHLGPSSLMSPLLEGCKKATAL